MITDSDDGRLRTASAGMAEVASEKLVSVGPSDDE